jgi:endonuclease G
MPGAHRFTAPARLMFDADYASRQGFDPAFLRLGQADAQVFLPTLRPALAAKATPLLERPKECVLHYRHFSLVMHKARRFAIYSAANVDFQGRFAMRRPRDVWRTDPRIAAEDQVTKAFYAHNQFDRGHLTRREDMEFGPTSADALSTAADTCHWTNCTPQHARFNEERQLWQGIERHILEDAVAQDRFRAQVITGPVFDAKDPIQSGFDATPYPLRYWKVVAAVNAAGKLFATAYILDQRETIACFGLRDSPAVPFPPFKTFQTTIAAIEKLTQLTFTGSRGTSRMELSAFDPLTQRKEKSRLEVRALPDTVEQEPAIALTALNQIVVTA